jgi:uncharacterized membrane protein
MNNIQLIKSSQLTKSPKKFNAVANFIGDCLGLVVSLIVLALAVLGLSLVLGGIAFVWAVIFKAFFA